MRARLLAPALATLAACATAAAPREVVEPAVVIRSPAEAPPGGCIELHARPAGDADALVVRVASKGRSGLPPVLGQVTRVEGALVFAPRYPLEAGLAYRVSWRDAEGCLHEREVALPPRELEPKAVVTAVHPSADVLPSNLLKFYMHFSRPMSRGEAYGHVRVLDAAGAVCAGVLLEIQPELWDPTAERLTLLLDPGRIKQGLRLREELGPALREGRVYTLEVDADWRDAEGAPLAAPFAKRFTTRAPDATAPEPARWLLTIPAAGSREPLAVTLDEALDHALLERVVRVRGADGSSVPGEVRITDGERRWAFSPREPWQPGSYRLEVEPILEDLAGNSVGRVFERELGVAADAPAPDTPRIVPFAVGQP